MEFENDRKTDDAADDLAVPVGASVDTQSFLVLSAAAAAAAVVLARYDDYGEDDTDNDGDGDDGPVGQAAEVVVGKGD